jgi:hypothetical protein
MKAQINMPNILAYLQGNIRELCYFKKNLKFLIRKHIREQIQYRLYMMDDQCKKSGHCIICGCATPGLQMADKACDKPCYPAMVNKADWFTFKYFNKIKFDYSGEECVMTIEKKRFKK